MHHHERMVGKYLKQRKQRELLSKPMATQQQQQQTDRQPTATITRRRRGRGGGRGRQQWR